MNPHQWSFAKKVVSKIENDGPKVPKTKVDRRTWLHLPSGTHWSNSYFFWDVYIFNDSSALLWLRVARRPSILNLFGVFIGPIGKTRWPPWPLVGWDIFDFCSKTAERNSTKLYRKQDPKVIYQVYVFRADRLKQDGHPASDWLRYFRLLLWNHWTDFNETWREARFQRNLTGSKISTSYAKFVFFGLIIKSRWPSGSLIGWDIFDFSS